MIFGAKCDQYTCTYHPCQNELEIHHLKLLHIQKILIQAFMSAMILGNLFINTCNLSNVPRCPSGRQKNINFTQRCQ